MSCRKDITMLFVSLRCLLFLLNIQNIRLLILVFQEIHFEFKFINNTYKFFAHYVDIWFISISNNIIRQIDSLRAQKSPY